MVCSKLDGSRRARFARGRSAPPRASGYLTATIVAAGLLHASAARAGCEKDTDCKGDRVCDKGECVAPASTSPGPTAPPTTPPLASTAPSADSPPAAPPADPRAVRVRLGPREEPYDGGPIPPGSRVVTRSRSGFIGAGAGMLGAGYFIALISGGIGVAAAASQDATGLAHCWSSAGLAFVPLLGPALYLGEYPNRRVRGTYDSLVDCGEYFGAAAAWTVGVSLLQWGGAALIATGLFVKKKVLVSEPVGTIASWNHLRLSLTPGTAGTPFGVTLSLTEL